MWHLNFRPPGARGTVSTFKLHDEDELPENKKVDNGSKNAPSKSALKNKKRREKKKDGDPEPVATAPAYAPTPASQNTAIVDPETAKKVRKLNDKLAQANFLFFSKALKKNRDCNWLFGFHI